jgi:hypothetical protein
MALSYCGRGCGGRLWRGSTWATPPLIPPPKGEGDVVALAVVLSPLPFMGGDSDQAAADAVTP